MDCVIKNTHLLIIAYLLFTRQIIKYRFDLHFNPLLELQYIFLKQLGERIVHFLPKAIGHKKVFKGYRLLFSPY